MGRIVRCGVRQAAARTTYFTTDDTTLRSDIYFFLIAVALALAASTQVSSQRLRVKMGASSRLMVSTIALMLVAASRAAVASMDASACAELGFTSGLECATCDALHKHVNHDGTCACSAGSAQFRVWLLCCARGHQRVVGSVRAADSSCVGFAHVAGLLAECQSCCSSGDGSVSSYVYAQLRVCS